MSRADASAELALRTTGLRKAFGEHAAVDGIDLRVPVGSVFGFLGPNGSGKTTTIRMLLGLIAPSDGEIELLGHAMPMQSRQALPMVGAMIEGPAFQPYLSGVANLQRLDRCDPTADPRTRSVRLDAALERVGLAAARTKRYRQYSLGMKQRLGIAAALLRPRRIFILDEPTNGLDPQGTREVRHLIRELADEGATVVISSHLLSEIEQMSSHVAIMSRGRLLAQGSLEEVLGRSRQRLTVRSPDPVRAMETLRRIGVADLRRTAGEVQGVLGDLAVEAVTPALVADGVPITGLSVDRPALEEFFVELTGEGFDVAA